MSVLLRIKSKSVDIVAVLEDKEEAKARARSSVGQHNSIDGCSTEPIETDYPANGRWHITRQSSFGRYEAWVIDQMPNGIGFQL